MNIDPIQLRILQEVAGLHDTPDGAYNFRFDGKSAGRNSTDNIKITTKTDKPGIDIHIAPGTKHESVHIPVVLSVMSPSWRAAASPTAAARTPSMTVSIPSISGTAAKCVTMRSTMVKATAWASGS